MRTPCEQAAALTGPGIAVRLRLDYPYLLRMRFNPLIFSRDAVMPRPYLIFSALALSIDAPPAPVRASGIFR